MIDAMPRPRPPHLQRQVTRHGKTVWYVRIGKGPRIRIRAEFGTPEFDVEYTAAISGTPRPKKGAPAAGSLAWLIERYRETGDWTDLSPATRRNRENHFKQVIKTAGDKPYRAITQAVIVAGKDRRAHTPAQARNYLDAMRGLFRWAKSAQHVSVDPVDGVANPIRKKGPGFPVWTEADVEAYYNRWPLGTKERVWLDVLLFTGLRRGDVVAIGRQHVRNGIATLRTEKSQGEITVTLPILPVLQRTLDAGPIGELAFICGRRGKPLKRNPSAPPLRRPALRPVCMTARRMGVARSARRGQQRKARALRNSMRYLAGVERRWHRSTHKPQIASGWQLARWR